MKWFPSTKSTPRLKQQKHNLKQQWIRDLMNSKMRSKLIKHQNSTPSTWSYQLSIQTNLIITMNNLLLISSNGQSLSHLKNIHMHKNLPNTYIPWPSKATHFFIFKNGGMPSLLTFVNPYQKTRSGQHKNLSHQKINIYLPLSSHRKPILNLLHQNKNMKHYQ